MKVLLGILLLCLFPVSLALAGGEFDCREKLRVEDQQTLIPEIEKYYASLDTLDGKFVQDSYTLGLNQREESKGRVYFKKPGLMDWWYEVPEKNKQRFVADGKSLWIYQPAIPQVVIGDFEQAFSSDLPVSFLLGIGKLSERFRLASACKSSAGLVLKLLPQKTDASLDEFSLLVEPSRKAPLGARLIDAGGNETTIVFNDINYNRDIDASHFKFDLPRNVDVIDKRSKEARG